MGKGATRSFDFVNDDDDARLDWALFRYRLIAEAVEAEKSARGPLLKAVAAEAKSTTPLVASS